MLSLLLAIIAGIVCGTITGITPGLHTNMVAVLTLAAAPFLIPSFGLLAVCCFIISMSITHTFLDVIPSVFLGAPNELTALGVLPGHRYLLRGQGLMAVKLTIIGAYFGLIASIILFPLFFLLVTNTYTFIQAYIPYLLIIVAGYMIIRDQHIIWAVLVFGLSGILGVLVFSLPLKDPLFPLLSGLFGISTLIYSLKEDNNLPEQHDEPHTKLETWQTVKAVISGNCSALLTCTLPGLSSSIAATISAQADKKLGDKGFMILMGTIGTAAFSLSLVTLLAIEKARNGSVAAITQLLPHARLPHILAFLAVALIAGSVAVLLTLNLGRTFARLLGRLNYAVISVCIICFITVLVLLLTGWLGLLVLLVSTSLGLIPAIVKTTRTQAMGCLMLPVMLYFL